MRKLLALLLAIIIVAAAAGCEVKEVNNSAIVTGVGIDWVSGQITTSLQLAEPAQQQEAGQTAPQFTVVSAGGSNLNDSLSRLSLTVPRNLLLSQSGLYIIGENLARKDISLVADSLFRNPDIRKNSPLVITRGVTPEQVLQQEVPLETFSGQAIPKLIRNEERLLGIYTLSTLEDFYEDLTNPRVEPAALLVTIEDTLMGPLIKLDGTAVFKSNKMIGSLNERESRGMRWLTPGMVRGGFETINKPFNTDTIVVMEITRSQAKFKPILDRDGITMQINIVAEGNFYEQVNQGDILTLQNVPVLEALTAREMEKDIRACLSKVQSLNSDILGWSRLIQDLDPAAWKQISNDWDELFPAVDYEVQVEFEMRRTYVTSKSFQLK